MRTSSEPARASACTCRAVPSTSAVFVLVMNCTTIGAWPPTRTAPMDTWAEIRRERLMRWGVYRLQLLGGMEGGCYHRYRPNRSVRRGSGSRAGTPKAQFRPETLRHKNGRRRMRLERTAGLLERGGSYPPTEGERRRLDA